MSCGGVVSAPTTQCSMDGQMRLLTGALAQAALTAALVCTVQQEGAALSASVIEAQKRKFCAQPL